MKLNKMLRDDFDVQGDPERAISGVAYDSRSIKGGEVFVAMKGEKCDGKDFIEDAIRRGAAAIVYEKGAAVVGLQAKHPEITWIAADNPRDAIAYLAHVFYRRPSEAIGIIGITGTNGKTTTTYLIKSILEQWRKNVGLIGTISYLIKDKVYDAPHTTPESTDFQELLRAMADQGCDYVVTEVSSHALAQRRVEYTRFKGAVFTNLTRDHLDFHKTMDSYFKAKQRLFTDLLDEQGFAVINGDDEYGQRLIKMLTERKGKAARVVSYAVEHRDADVTASDIATTFKGMSFKITYKRQKSEAGSQKPEAASDEMIQEKIVTPLVGIINVYNILAAIGVALSLDIPITVIKEGIAMAELINGRFEKVDVGQDFLAIVDYAHTEDALERLLRTARQLLDAYRFTGRAEKMMKAKGTRFPLTSEKGKGKIITVIGCGGNRDKGKRSKMGEIASKLSDFVIITSDNPRFEDPKAIIRDIEKGIKGDNYIVIPDRNVAISMAVELASSGDIVMVAGKGHEDYQEIQGIRHAFSDRTALESAIKRTISRPAFGGGTTFDGLYSSSTTKRECSC
ncbi:MAG: UDP-N-acetylmuramoyl-L-alanyl-D-glutamate--2,6-diaminopimelate ligase [Nitrospirota bacterium]